MSPEATRYLNGSYHRLDLHSEHGEVLYYIRIEPGFPKR